MLNADDTLVTTNTFEEFFFAVEGTFNLFANWCKTSGLILNARKHKIPETSKVFI